MSAFAHSFNFKVALAVMNIHTDFCRINTILRRVRTKPNLKLKTGIFVEIALHDYVFLE